MQKLCETRNRAPGELTTEIGRWRSRRDVTVLVGVIVLSRRRIGRARGRPRPRRRRPFDCDVSW
jgi:hypothetical protein